MDTRCWVSVGKIVKAHGVRGGLKILPYGESLAFKQRGDLLFIKKGENPPDKFTIRRIQPAGRCWIISTEEIRSRNEAEKLIGFEVYLPEELLPPREDGEFYYYQLIGMEVRTSEGKKVGIVDGIFETPAHDVYVVKNGGSEILIPAVEEFVLEVNVEDGYMVVDLPDGLKEDDH